MLKGDAQASPSRESGMESSTDLVDSTKRNLIDRGPGLRQLCTSALRRSLQAQEGQTPLSRFGYRLIRGGRDGGLFLPPASPTSLPDGSA